MDIGEIKKYVIKLEFENGKIMYFGYERYSSPFYVASRPEIPLYYDQVLNGVAYISPEPILFATIYGEPQLWFVKQLCEDLVEREAWNPTFGKVIKAVPCELIVSLEELDEETINNIEEEVK